MANTDPVGSKLCAAAFFGGAPAPVVPMMMMGIALRGGSLFPGEALARLFPPMGGARGGAYRYCPACGTRLDAAFRFCIECGAAQPGAGVKGDG